MEQDVDNVYRAVCGTCLSGDRNLFSVNGAAAVYQIFHLLMYDFAADRFRETITEMEHLVCWECLALMKKFHRFKQQAHNAQEHLRVLTLSRTQESLDHTYMSQSLSSLEATTKVDYDKIYYDYSGETDWSDQYITIATASHSVKNEQYDMAQVVRDNINLDILEEIVLEHPVTGVMGHIVVGPDSLVAHGADPMTVKGELSELGSVSSMPSPKLETVVLQPTKHTKEESEKKCGYVTEYMSEADMLASREEAKKKIQYASAVYKCELCIIGFYTQQQVEEHFVCAHREKPGLTPCKVCYVYVEESRLLAHIDEHYYRYSCKLCGHVDYSARLAAMHAHAHMARQPPTALVKIGDAKPTARKQKKRMVDLQAPKPGDLRKLLSKTTIEGYQCLECDMFFKNSRARKNHVARYHREGLQCDHCKKRFVNRTTLATHLRLHEGPLPRSECPICHKMVRVIQLKYHIQRHQNKSKYECVECNKVFSHLATYQAHLKYSRAHASDSVFKFPCPMCNKGYPTKEQMQDHFNYQHLGKTEHKCPVCDKPIASRANVEKHIMRVHGKKKDKPRNHTCQQCGKAFTDKKALTQHAVIHSGERPLTCDICQQTFKQKASLYTHRKRVHKVFPVKRKVEFMESKHRPT